MNVFGLIIIEKHTKCIYIINYMKVDSKFYVNKKRKMNGAYYEPDLLTTD